MVAATEVMAVMAKVMAAMAKVMAAAPKVLIVRCGSQVAARAARVGPVAVAEATSSSSSSITRII